MTADLEIIVNFWRLCPGLWGRPLLFWKQPRGGRWSRVRGGAWGIKSNENVEHRRSNRQIHSPPIGPTAPTLPSQLHLASGPCGCNGPVHLVNINRKRTRVPPSLSASDRRRQFTQKRQSPQRFPCAENSCRRLFLRTQLEGDFEVGPPPPTPMSVYLGHATADPPGDLRGSVSRRSKHGFRLFGIFLLTSDPRAGPAPQKKGALAGDVFVFTPVWQGLFRTRDPLCLDSRAPTEPPDGGQRRV